MIIIGFLWWVVNFRKSLKFNDLAASTANRQSGITARVEAVYPEEVMQGITFWIILPQAINA